MSSTTSSISSSNKPSRSTLQEGEQATQQQQKKTKQQEEEETKTIQEKKISLAQTLLSSTPTSWKNSFQAVITHVKQYKEWPNQDTDSVLYNWIEKQRQNYHYLSLQGTKKTTANYRKSMQQFNQLIDIGFPFTGSLKDLKPKLELFAPYFAQPVSTSPQWQDHFNNLVEHIKQYKEWPTHQNNPKMRQWINNQRTMYAKSRSFTQQSLQRFNLLKQLGFPFDALIGRRAFDGKPNLSSPLLSMSTTTNGTRILQKTDDNPPQAAATFIPPNHNNKPSNAKDSEYGKDGSSTNSANHLSLSATKQQSLPSSQAIQAQQHSSTGKRKHNLLHQQLSSHPPSRSYIAATAENNGVNKRQRILDFSRKSNNAPSSIPHRVTPSPVQQHPPLPILVNPAMWWSVSAHNNNPANYNNATRLLHHCMCRYNWDRPLAIRILRAYRQFLELKVVMKDNHENISRNNNKNGRGKLVPSRLVNQMWQRHVLDNAHYRKDCHVICKGQEIYYHDQDEYYGSAGLGRNNNNKERQEKTLVALEARFGSDEVDMEIWNFEENNRICARQAEEDEPQESGTQVSTDDSTTSQEESDGGTDMKAANNNNDDNMNDSNPPIADNDNKKPECVGVTLEPMNETLPSKQQDQQQPKETEAAAAAAPPPPPTTTNRSKSASDSSKSAIVLSVIDKHNGEVICFRILETKKLSKIFAVYTQRKRMENDEQKSQEWQFGLKDKDGNLTVIDPNATSEALGLKEGDEIVAWQKGK